MAKRKARVPTDPICAEARERWNRCDEAEDAQRKSILAAKKFRSGDQWPEAIRLQREGANSIQGQAAQPPRPCLTIDRLSPPVRQVANQIKSANFAIDVLPNGFGADTDTAELFKGYLRRVQVQAKEESPVEWAAEQAAEGGIGWFRIRTKYVHETWTGPVTIEAFDQELTLERIKNNLTVYDDPSCTKPTHSDSHFRIITEDLDRNEYIRLYGDEDIASLDDFAATGDTKGWVDKDMVRIAEYWRIEYKDKPLTFGEHTRTMSVPVVECYTINAVRVLKKYDWLGSRIPHVPILGEELDVDGRTVLRGIIQEGMDAQRMVNYSYSGAMEIFALGNKSPYIVEETQLGPYGQIWQTANVYNYSYLPYVKANDVPPPHRDVSEAPIQAAVQLMQKSEEAINATTSVYSPSPEYNNPKELSGRALEARDAISQQLTSGYGFATARALVYAGVLMLEIIPKLTRPGQLIQIMGTDDEPKAVIVGQPFIEGEKGQPQPLTPEQAQQQQGLAKVFDLNSGRYGVAVAVGKSSATKREEGAAALGNLIPHLPPEMAAVATPDYVEQLSFTGAHKIAEKLKKALPPALQDQDDPANQIPPQAQAMIQGLQQQLQQAAEIIKTDQVKQQATLQKAQLDAQTQLQTTQMELASKEKIALIQSATQANIAQGKIDAEDARTYADAIENRVGTLLELHMKRLGQIHEAQQQQHAQAHDHASAVELATLKHQQTKDAAEQAQAHGIKSMTTQAALQPAPEANGAGA